MRKYLLIQTELLGDELVLVSKGKPPSKALLLLIEQGEAYYA